MATARTFTSNAFALTLEGVACGFVSSTKGGGISAEVVEEPAGPDFFVHKRLGRPKYEDFTLQFGFGMAQPLYDWIAASWAGNFVRKDGALTEGDVNMNAKSERQFSKALVKETTIPALDASSKDAAHLTLTFTPEVTRSAKSSGKLPASAGREKSFSAANFRLELDGLDCTKVTRIDSFTVELPVTVADIGERRDIERLPGRIDFPNLRVTLGGGASAESWAHWFQDFVIKGDNDDSKEKSGAIVFLAPDKTELGRIALFGVGIFALRPVAHAANEKSAAAALTADLYCERMELHIGKPQPVRPTVEPLTKPLGVRR